MKLKRVAFAVCAVFGLSLTVMATISIDPVTVSIGTGGAPAKSIKTAGDAGESWSATTAYSWITLTAASGTAGSPCRYAVSANLSTSPRTGTIVISGNTCTITQTGYAATVSPNAASYGKEGGTGSVSVDLPPGVAWDAHSNCHWLTVVSTSTSSGSGTLTYSVAEYTGVIAREGSITVAGQTLTVSQTGVDVMLTPSSHVVTNASVNTFEFKVTAMMSTQWTVVPNASWISVVDAGPGHGDGFVRLAVGENASVRKRSGTVTIGSKTFYVTQYGMTDYRLDITPTEAEAPAEGAFGSVAVMVNPDLGWMANSLNPWITLTENATGVGNMTAKYVAAVNGTLSNRTGVVRFTVTEPDPEVELARGLTRWQGTAWNSDSAYDAAGTADPAVSARTTCLRFQLTTHDTLHRLATLNSGAAALYVNADNLLVFQNGEDVHPFDWMVDDDAYREVFISYDGEKTAFIGRSSAVCTKLFEIEGQYAITAYGESTLPSQGIFNTNYGTCYSSSYYYWNRALDEAELSHLNEGFKLEPKNASSSLYGTMVHYAPLTMKAVQNWQDKSVRYNLAANASPAAADRRGVHLNAMKGDIEPKVNVQGVPQSLSPTTRNSWYQDSYGWRSPHINDNGMTSMFLSLSGTGILQFDWRISSEYNFDYLKLSVDGVEQFTNKGENYIWSTKTVSIGAGTHTIAWTYRKDVSQSSGYDCGWVRNITFTPFQATSCSSMSYNLWMRLQKADEKPLFGMGRLSSTSETETFPNPSNFQLRGGLNGFRFYENGTYYGPFGSNLDPNTWYMVTVTYSEPYATIYLNGQEIGNYQTSGYQYFVPELWCAYGAESGAIFDEIETFSSQLTSAQVAALYELEKPIEQEHVLTQGAYMPSVSTNEFIVAANGQSGLSVALNVDSHVGWTVENPNDWIVLDNGSASHMGTGTLTFDVLRNRAVEPRTGTVLIAGLPVTFVQDGLELEVETDFSVFGTDSDSGYITITTEDDATWTATSDSSWLYLSDMADSGQTYTGCGPMELIVGVDEYTASTAMRTGTITIGDTVIYVTQRGYNLTIDPYVAEIGSNNGAGDIGVTAPIGAIWQVLVSVPWIHVDGTIEQSGTGTLHYTVDENDTGAIRTGKIVISGEEYELTQKCKLNVVVAKTGKGTVTGAGAYDTNDSATLSATPAAHYHFKEWLGDYVGIENPGTFTVDCDKNVTAVFEHDAVQQLEITGPATVYAGESRRFVAQAVYPNGEREALDAVWTVDSGSEHVASLENGILAAAADTEGQVTLRATFTSQGVTAVATLNVAVHATVDLCAAVSCYHEFTSSGTTGWFGQTDETVDDDGAARSGWLENGGTNDLAVTVTAPGTVSYQWKAVAGTDSALELLVDGAVRTNYDFAVTGWQTVTFDLPDNAAHELRWRYRSAAGGYALVDAFTWTAAPATTTITFDANGGTVAEPSHVYATGVPYGAFPAATRTGYAFVGWQVDVTTTNLVDVGAYVSFVPLTFHAKWAANSFAVSFDGNGGTGAMETQPFVYDVEQALASNDFMRVGYTFAGWSTAADGAVAYADGALASNLTAVADATVTLYAKWAANAYTVSFDANGGEGTMDPQPFTYDVAADLTASAFTRAHYSFAGWSTTPGGVTAYADGVAVSNLTAEADGSVALYAVWSPDHYTVGFNANGGTGEMEDQDYAYDVRQMLRPNGFVRTGYEFVGWATNAEDSVAYADTQSVSNLTGVADARVELFAKWTPNAYSVRFGAGGGAGSMDDQVLVYDVAQGLTSNAFVRTGYTFAWWRMGAETYVDGAVVSNLTDLAEEIVELLAVWSPNQYVVRYLANGGEGTMSDQTLTYDAGAALVDNAFAKTGYSLAGWAISAEGEAVYAPGAVVSNLTAEAGGTYDLYAVWTQNVYSVAFDANGGEGEMASQSFRYDEEQAICSNAFVRTGYSFAGWATNAEDDVVFADGATVSNLTAEASGLVTLYAKWTANAYSTAYDANGGEGEMAGFDCTYDVEATLASNAFARTHYTFAGWAMTSTGAVVYADGAVVSNLTAEAGGLATLFAVWDPDRYEIAFNAPGCEGAMERQPCRWDVPAEIVSNAFAKAGYTFAGWATNASDSAVYADGAMVTNLTDVKDGVFDLYACWTNNAYAVAFSANGGIGTMDVQPFVYDVEQALASNAFERAGYTFAGWSDAADGEVLYADREVISNLTAQADGVATLHAIWTANPYRISFDANGGTGDPMETIDATYGVECELSANRFEKTGYTFAGWALEPNGEVVVEVGASALNLTAEYNGSVVLYAKWQANEYLVCFDCNGGAGEMEAQTFVFDEPQALAPNAFTLGGYTFSAWSFENGEETVSFADGEVVSNLTDEAEGEVTVSAQWIPNSYTVEFVANGGEGTMEAQSFMYDEAQELSACGFTRTGYTFDHWSTDSFDCGDYFDDGEEVENLTDAQGGVFALYAIWSANSYSVAFDANGGEGAMDPLPAVYDEDGSLPASSFTRTGYGFAGWSLSPTGSVAYASGASFVNLSAEFDGAVTLYAVWTPNAYSVAFMANGGEGTMEPQAFAYDVEQNLQSNQFVRTGYAFTGWSTTVSGEVVYGNGAAVVSLAAAEGATVTLYAQWAPVSVTVHGFRQRFPWNGLVDIDCEAFGEPGAAYQLNIQAMDVTSGDVLTVTDVRAEGGAASGNPVTVPNGRSRVIWNAATDLPDGFRSERIKLRASLVFGVDAE